VSHSGAFEAEKKDRPKWARHLFLFLFLYFIFFPGRTTEASRKREEGGRSARLTDVLFFFNLQEQHPRARARAQYSRDHYIPLLSVFLNALSRSGRAESSAIG